MASKTCKKKLVTGMIVDLFLRGKKATILFLFSGATWISMPNLPECEWGGSSATVSIYLLPYCHIEMSLIILIVLDYPYTNLHFVLCGALTYFKWTAHQKRLGITVLGPRHTSNFDTP